MISIDDYAQHIFESKTLALAPGVSQEAIDFFEVQKLYDLPIPSQFNGAGVYAVYYLGDFAPYKPISDHNQKNCDLPIYIGKAVPPGSRTANVREGEHQALYGRISDHLGNIEAAATTLRKEDFKCRFMILAGKERDFIAPIESSLINYHHALWNQLSFGFGLHPPSENRYEQLRPKWDTLHPGRYWAALMPKVRPVSLVEDEIKAHLALYPP